MLAKMMTSGTLFVRFLQPRQVLDELKELGVITILVAVILMLCTWEN